MASEFTRPALRGHEFYLHLHDLQPPTQHYMPYDISQPISTPVFELTAGGACAPLGPGASHVTLQPMQASHHQHDPRKRKNSQYTDCSDMSGCDSQLQPPATPCTVVSAPRKRKLSSLGTASTYEEDVLDENKSLRSVPGKKQNHSEIEKRRRDKMNTYIMELSSMVPMCGAMARKLDKLTVLRMAVQYLRSIRGALSACPLTARPRPAFLSERELNSLVLQAANDCFLLVVGCDRGRLLYVSASVKQMLHYEQSELLGQSLFDILHPKDVAKVKEQLSSPDLSPRERLIDAKTMLPVKTDVVAGASRLCPGARRSFFCRIKCKLSPDAGAPEPMPVKEESEPSSKIRRKQTNEKKYCVVQCTGYLKSWAPAELSDSGMSSPEGVDDGDASNMSCLVAVVRALPDLVPEPFSCDPDPPTRHLQYVSRHAPDGKFLFVDQRVTLALGFLPQELLGTSLYEYVSGPELGAVAQTHKSALLQRDALHTPAYSFRRKDGSLARIQTYFKPFKNPWTKDVECLVAQNTVSESPSLPESETEQTSFDLFKQTGLDQGSLEEVTPIDLLAACDVASAVSEGDMEMQRLIDSQVESHKIGSAIAEEALRRASSELAPDMPVDLLQDAVFNQQWQLTANVMCEQASLADNVLGAELTNFSQVRNNVPLSSAGPESSPPHPDPTDNLPQTTTPPVSPPLPTLGLDGNGEAAMAVIMSLLEADAGLGGPVNFSGLPWPLP